MNLSNKTLEIHSQVLLLQCALLKYAVIQGTNFNSAHCNESTCSNPIFEFILYSLITISIKSSEKDSAVKFSSLLAALTKIETLNYPLSYSQFSTGKMASQLHGYS